MEVGEKSQKVSGINLFKETQNKRKINITMCENNHILKLI